MIIKEQNPKEYWWFLTDLVGDIKSDNFEEIIDIIYDYLDVLDYVKTHNNCEKPCHTDKKDAVFFKY